MNLEKKNENLERLISVLVKQNDKQTKETENLWKEVNKNKVIYDKKIEKLIGLYLSIFEKPSSKLQAQRKQSNKYSENPFKYQPFEQFGATPKKNDTLMAPNYKYINKLLKKNATQNMKASMIKEIKSTEPNWNKFRQKLGGEFMDLSNSNHVYVKRTHHTDELEDCCENEEETPEIPKLIRKKKVKKLKEKTSNLTSLRKKANPAILLDPLPSSFFNEFNPEKIFLDFPGNEEKINSGFKAFSTVRTPVKNHHVKLEQKNEHEQIYFDGNSYEEKDDFYEELLADLSNDSKCKVGFRKEVFEEEEEDDNQIENDFENNAFIDDFNGFNYNNEEEGP